MKAKFVFSLICVAAVTLTACEQYPYGYGGYGGGYGSSYGGYRYGYPYSGYGYGGKRSYGGCLRYPYGRPGNGGEGKYGRGLGHTSYIVVKLAVGYRIGGEW